MRESYIEKKVCEYAASKGWSNMKCASPGQRGSPDRMFYRSMGEVRFVEFKKPGGRVTELQRHVLMRLFNAGFRCAVIDSIEEGRRFFDE